MKHSSRRMLAGGGGAQVPISGGRPIAPNQNPTGPGASCCSLVSTTQPNRAYSLEKSVLLSLAKKIPPRFIIHSALPDIGCLGWRESMFLLLSAYPMKIPKSIFKFFPAFLSCPWRSPKPRGYHCRQCRKR